MMNAMMPGTHATPGRAEARGGSPARGPSRAAALEVRDDLRSAPGADGLLTHFRDARTRETSNGRRHRHRSRGPAERFGLRRMPRLRWLVVPSPPLREMRPYRLLRLVTVAACEPPCRRSASPGRPELRARRGLVLGLRDGGVPRGSRPGSAESSSRRSAGAGTSRPRARGMAAAAALTRMSAIVPQSPERDDPAAA